MKDYYKILGVARTAKKEEIRASFAKLANSEHPDKHGNSAEANEKFKDINEAYGVLRNEKKRSEYDKDLKGGGQAQRPAGQPSGGGTRTGTTPGPRGTTVRAANLDDMMGSVFGMPGMSGMPGFGKRGTSEKPGSAQSPAQPEDSISISLEEAFVGASKTFKIDRQVTCPDCRGTGVSQAGRSGLQLGTRCMTCVGKKRVRRQEEVPVKVPAGVYDGAKLAVGDLRLKVSIQKHARYELRDKDILAEKQVPYPIMVLGGEVDVETPGGPRKLKIPPGTKSGKQIQITGMGLPTLGKRPAGDFKVRVSVLIPEYVSPDERELLIKLARIRGDAAGG